MLEGFLERQQRRIEALEAAYDGLPPPETEIVIERRVRVVAGFYRAMKLAVQLAGMTREAAEPQEDNEDGMRERLDDPEALERKHREIDERLARIRQHLDAGGAAIMDDTRRNGSLPQELAHEGQPRAA